MASIPIAQDVSLVSGTSVVVAIPLKTSSTPAKSETRSSSTVVVTPIAQGIYSQKVTKFRLASSPVMNNSFGGSRASF